MCNHPYHPFLKLLHPPKLKLGTHQPTALHSPTPQKLATTILHSVSMSLTILGNHKSGIIQHWPFCGWIMSLSTVFKVHQCSFQLRNLLLILQRRQVRLQASLPCPHVVEAEVRLEPGSPEFRLSTVPRVIPLGPVLTLQQHQEERHAPLAAESP